MDLSVLDPIFYGNTYRQYVVCALILLGGFVFQRFISFRLSRLLYNLIKSLSEGVVVKEFTILLVKPMRFLVFLIFLYIAFDRLDFPSEWHLANENKFGLRMFIERTYQGLIIVAITWIVLRMVDFFALVLRSKVAGTESRSNEQIVPFIRDGIKIMLVILSFFVLLGSLFKINIASLVAGLGVGGLAIALAAKETLENLLGSFTLFMDKPFVIGDFVKVGAYTGYVEKIGFRSTRIRTLDRSIVTVPNKKMVDAETENLSLRPVRRAEYTIYLDFTTSTEQLNTIVEDIKRLLKDHPTVDKEEILVAFYAFSKYGFEIQIDVCFDITSTADLFREKEAVNFLLLEIVRQNGATFSTLPI